MTLAAGTGDDAVVGKGLDDEYDLGKFAQPFVERLIDKVKYGGDSTQKAFGVFGKATGLNVEDVRPPAPLAFGV